MENFLSAEPLIVARLEAKVPGVKVFSAADLAGVAEAKQTTPALHVLFSGYRPTRQQEGSHGRIQEGEQTWFVVAAVRNLRSPQTGEHAREEAGPVLATVLAALQGWKPSTGHGPLELAPGARAGFKNGFGYFPLAFTTKVVTRGDG